MKVRVSHSVMSNSMTPCTVACQAPLFMDFQARILEWVAISFSAQQISKCRIQNCYLWAQCCTADPWSAQDLHD